MGTVRFGNDHFTTITGYGDYVQGNLMGDDLLTSSQESNLYTISISELAAFSLAQILKLPTDNGTQFKNEKLRSDAPQMVTSLEESITQESSTPVLETHFDKQIQEDVTKLDGNTIMHSFEIPKFEQAESSSNYQNPSNMHEFHQQHRYTDK
ncbi:hypothetical protein Tco_1525186 [Tanacetum coccineum]